MLKYGTSATDHSLHICGSPGCLGPTRRGFMRAVPALAASIGMPALVRGQAAPRRPLIDFHHHHFPPEYVAAAVKSGFPIAPPMKNWTLDKTLNQMDTYGIRTSILVLARATGVWEGASLEDARRLARICNEHGARMMHDYPGRFGQFAWLPMPDVDGSLAEIAYALDVLKADGIGFFTSYNGKYPGDPAFRPVFEELDRREALVYFHPFAPNCCERMIPGVGDNYIEYTQDTARAVMSLLFSGTFAQLPNIQWLFSHGGGPIPILAGRVATLAKDRAKDLQNIAPNGIEAELKRLNFETANAAYGPTMAALLDFAPLGQIVFGTDYPYVSVGENVEDLAQVKLTDAQRRAIESGNAGHLIPRLAG